VAGERDVALAALRRYDVTPRRVTFAAQSFNSVFRVTAASGIYALRVGSAVRIHPEGTTAVERSPPHPPHLVHGDLTPANVIVPAGGGLVPIDFQDTVLGLEIQDLSITVAILRRRPDGARLAGAFRSGYASCRPWPDVSPAVFESLIIARLLHTMNLTLNFAGPDGLESYVADRAERIRTWMQGAS
jgi:Ser/Thr protein kinase RdoA (MazF antagonist)